MGKIDNSPKIELEEILRLAKEGNFSRLNDLKIFLTNNDPEVRIKAAYIIQLIGFDGAISELEKMALHDKVSVNRNQAIWALVGIGKPGVIKTLIEALKDKDVERREDARAALYTILGNAIRDLIGDEDGVEKTSTDEYLQLDKYWEANKKKYDPDLVYAYGLKCSPEVYIRQLKSADSDLPDAILDSLHYFTGQKFGQSPLKTVIKKWENWWTEFKGNYKEGHRYFYGFEVPTESN